MSLSLAESQALNEMAQLLYSFLPATPHPFADQSISFPGVAQDLGLSNLWKGGSKQPAITTLLERTLRTHRGKFCQLILDIVHRGLKYRSSKGNPITYDEIRRLNELVARVHFKIPELWDPAFLDSLPSAEVEVEEEEQVSQEHLDKVMQELLELEKMEAQARGYAFQQFLEELFALFDLVPRSPFRLVGEEIDGSFQLDADTYLVGARWRKERAGNEDLLVFHGKVKSKATWSRGLFISYSGFTPGGLEAFSKIGATSIIAITGEDLYFILEGEMSLVDAIRLKARRAAETGEILVSVYELGLEKGRGIGA